MRSKPSIGEGYPFHCIKKRPSVKGGLLICTHTYRFKTRLNRVYLVDVEQYQHKIFIIKFFLKNHQDSDKRFNLTTREVREVDGERIVVYDNDGWRIISTCLHIMLDIRAKHPLMSGGFIGANKEGESKDNTTRFRIWQKVALAFFDPDKYTHYPNESASAYFIECKANSKDQGLLVKAEEMFNRLYAMPAGLFDDTRTAQAG
jgi:hypothetical protein